MGIKKIISLVLTLSVVLMLSACDSPETLGFMNLSMELSEMTYNNLIESEGEISIDLHKVPDEIANELNFSLLKVYLDQYSLTYKSKMDIENNNAAVDFYLKDKNGNETLVYATLIKDGRYYIKVDEIIKGLSLLNDPMLNSLLESMEGIEYITYTEEDMMDLFSIPSMSGLTFNSILNPEMSMADLMEYSKELNDQYLEVFKDFEFDYIEKEGNKYTFTLTAEEALPLFKSFTSYTMDHIEEIGDLTLDVYDQYFADSFYQQFLFMEKSEFISMLEESFDEIKGNTEELKSELDALDEYQTFVVDTLGDSKLEYSIEKLDENAYETAFTFFGDIKIDDQEFGFTINVTGIDRKAESFEFDEPTEGVTTLEELMTLFGGFNFSYPATFVLDTSSGSYSFINAETMTDGEVGFEVKEDIIYVQIRPVAEMFGEQVGWDQSLQQAYIVRDEKIYLPGYILEGSFYVAADVFNSLGYELEWMPEYNMLIITQ
jgi:hypothetical protein